MVKAVVGANWGDEGKGKITDMLAQEADIIVRFQGGANAGHTIVNDYGKFALHTLPSGVFYNHTTSVIGNGVALNIPVFFKEYNEVIERGVPAPKIMISDRAQIVMPYHILFDQYEEERLGGKSFGSTKSGIAPFYSDKYAKIGFQVNELFHDDALKEKVERVVATKNVLLEHLYHKPLIDPDELLKELLEYKEMVAPYVCDVSLFLHNALKEGKEILAKAGITEADLDAWYLLEFVTGITKARYYMDPDQSMDPEAWKKYKEYLEKRRNHIPLQHITGSQEFMGLEFLVNEHVLIPRQDTEVLVEEALEIMKQERFRSKGCLQLLDMCTGSGCILLSVMHYAEQKGIFIEGTGVDFSEQALMVAQKNEKHLRSTKKDENGKVNWILSDLFENVSETYDMILSNPPYIRTAEIEKLQDEVKLHDPFSALDGKEDGLYFYRKIVTDAKQFLKTGGILAFEIGYDQGKEVSDLMKKAGYDKVFVKKDLAGLDRIVCGVYY